MHGKFGIALVKEKTKSEPVLFFRVRSKSKALDYFESLGIKNEKLAISGDKKDSIYSYPQSHNFSFSFIGPYLFISEKQEILKLIQSVYIKKESSLNEDKDYKKTISNLPKYAWGRGYLNIKSLNFNSQNPINQMIDPLKYIINHFGLSVRKQHNGFHFNSLLSINPQLLELKKGYTDSSNFSYELASYIGSKNLAIYVGGSNLSDEWENTLKTISKLNPAYGVILEGVIRAQVSNVFGDQVNLRNDIYPIFKDEYALVFEKLSTLSKKPDIENKGEITVEDHELGIKLILKHSDEKFAKAKLNKLLAGFRLLAARLTPKLKVFKLTDGKEGKEFVASVKDLRESKEKYKNYEINCLDIADSYYGFCYTVTDKLIVISNNQSSIKETIDLGKNYNTSLKNHHSFKKSLSKLSTFSDEITFVKFDSLNKLMSNAKLSFGIGSLFDSFESVAWVKQYFDDGVSTEGYLLLK